MWPVAVCIASPACTVSMPYMLRGNTPPFILVGSARSDIKAGTRVLTNIRSRGVNLRRGLLSYPISEHHFVPNREKLAQNSHSGDLAKYCEDIGEAVVGRPSRPLLKETLLQKAQQFTRLVPASEFAHLIGRTDWWFVAV